MTQPVTSTPTFSATPTEAPADAGSPLRTLEAAMRPDAHPGAPSPQPTGRRPLCGKNASRRVVTMTAVADVLMLTISLLVAMQGRNWLTFLPHARDVDHFVTPIAVFLVVGWVAILAAFGLYRTKNLGAGTEEYQKVLTSSLIAAGMTGAVMYLTGYELSRGFFVLLFLIGLAALLVGRLVVRRMVQYARGRGHLLNRVIIAGAGRHVEEIAAVISRERWLGYSIAGAAVPAGMDIHQTRSGIPVLGHTDDLAALAAHHDIDAVICTEGAFATSKGFRRLAWELENKDTQMVVVPSLTDISAERLAVRPVAGLPLVHVEQPQSEAASRWTKRLFDLVGSAALIAVSSPIMLAVAVAIKLDDGGPILFRQTRVGRNGEVFSCLKFRSMVVDAEARMAELRARNESDGVLFKMARDPRITKVGHFIRRYSLDEFPQFFNVFRGDMSLVGPRPALPTEVEQYESHVRRRLDVRPGITGLWQVSGRSDLSWEDTVRLDLYYVDNWSMMQDASILFRTAKAVLGSDGAY